MPDTPSLALVGAIEPTDEPLTGIEANYLRLAKADADRALGQALTEIIRGHGHNDQDGRHYNFITEEPGARLVLRISQPNT